MMKEKLFRCIPVLALLCYWLYAGLAAAMASRDPRLLALGAVTLPLLAAMLAALGRTLYSGGSGA